MFDQGGSLSKHFRVGPSIVFRCEHAYKTDILLNISAAGLFLSAI